MAFDIAGGEEGYRVGGVHRESRGDGGEGSIDEGSKGCTAIYTYIIYIHINIM